MTEVKPLSDVDVDGTQHRLNVVADVLRENGFMVAVSFIEDASATITALKSENEKLTSALRLAEEAMTDFLENPLYQVGVGGNPNRVERMINNARAALSSARAALAKETK